jgi:hypothetical protein
VVTLRDNDSPATFQFERARYAFGETNSGAAIAVTRTANLDIEATVRLQSVGGPQIFEINQVLHFLPGEQRKVIAVVIVNDEVSEENKSVLFHLTDPGLGCKLGSPARATLVIKDDESN